MEDAGELTRRFHDFIDKLQFVIDTIKEGGLATEEVRHSAENTPLWNACAVSSDPGDMECRLETLFSSIDSAIENIEKIFISQGTSSGETPADRQDEVSRDADAAPAPSHGNGVFTPEELTFLGQTFHKILNTPHDERQRLYEGTGFQER